MLEVAYSAMRTAKRADFSTKVAVSKVLLVCTAYLQRLCKGAAAHKKARILWGPCLTIERPLACR